MLTYLCNKASVWWNVQTLYGASRELCCTWRYKVYSIDECFLKLTAYEHLFDLTVYAQDMRAKAWRWLGLPCCIGIGRSKTEAKIANHLAKKNKFFNGVCNLAHMDPCSTETLLAQVDVSEVWGVGRQNCKKLNTMGVQSVLDLINANPKEIKKQFSIVRLCCTKIS